MELTPTTELPALCPDNIARILSESGALANMRALLAQFKHDSYEHFLKHGDADLLVRNRAVQMDHMLRTLWQHFSIPTDGAALIAVGGYGRAELHPYSDIDVLLLFKHTGAINQHGESLQSFITWLWDLKLEIGHSVRTLDECLQHANDDLTIITNLIESRLLLGDDSLFDDLNAHIQTEHMWQADAFFNAKWEELKSRHRKHNESEYNLEPNVKNSPGTLRDLQTVSWVTSRHFGNGDLDTLVAHGFITKDEERIMSEQRSFFWKLRFVLHMLADREEDRIVFDLQETIAERLGYVADDNRSAVERFMWDFYRHQIITTELCDVLLLHFNEDFIQRGDLTSIESVNDEFLLQNGYLLIRDPELFRHQPKWLLKTFWLMTQLPQVKGVHSDTVRALRAHRHLIDEDFRQNPEHNAIFMDIITSERRVVMELSRMTRYGILGRYLPDYGRIVGMMEHDLFNVHTVHDHTLRCVRWLRYLRFGQLRDDFPVASRLIHRVNKPEVLYLATFLHDLGKGRAGNEIQNSADIAKMFCRQHNLRPTDTHLIVWLIENQALMSDTAHRIDLYNPEHVHHFACLIGDQNKLEMLYLLSVTNTINTNADHWSDWQATQMRDLFNATQSALRRGLENMVDKRDIINEIKEDALTQLQQHGMSRDDVLTLWGNPGDEYFLREGTNNVVWHALEIAKHKHSPQQHEPLIAIRHINEGSQHTATQIFIYTKDSPNLFSAVAATLDRLNLNIQDARIMTSEEEKNALDTFVVLDENNEAVNDRQRLSDIQHALQDTINTCDQFCTLSQRRARTALQHFHVKLDISLSTDTSSPFTILEITTSDQPGLLARISRVLSQHQIHIHKAKILTAGERASDIFYISNRDDQPFTDPEECQQLIDILTDVLGKNNDA